ncbi:EAL domain-containing protein, partial [Thermomonas fusca]
MRLYYQPIIDASRRVVGVEGLLGWQHPVRGLLSPGLFMPLAEQSQLIVPIGLWVLDTACAQ